jgi:hypothetical protein
VSLIEKRNAYRILAGIITEIIRPLERSTGKCKGDVKIVVREVKGKSCAIVN